ncbi:MAG: CapA family protein [Planctomycetes bacterium]|nr:CapA family protein [Planctomycetota bacterium]
MVSLLIGGDLCPIGRNTQLFQEGDAFALFGGFLSEIQKNNLTIVNLECPLIDIGTPIQKEGPVLGVPRRCISGIKKAGIDILNLANNHIMDHGAKGLQTTIRTCNQNEIKYVGAGENLKDARKVLVQNINTIAVGILSVAEHEFSIATRDFPGANPLVIIDLVRTIQEHSSDWDLLIVLLHGGNEFYPYPSPWLKNTCRFMIEQGADAVICQHSHCSGCIEIYQGAPIVYGQGNLLFDADYRPNMWYEGMLVSLEFDIGKSIRTRLIPFKQIRGRPGIHEMSEKEEAAFRSGFNARSEIVLDDKRLDDEWKRFCERHERDYLRLLYGHMSLVHRVTARMGLLERFYTKRKRLFSLSAIQCESSREALLDILADNNTRGPERKCLSPEVAKRQEFGTVLTNLIY